MTKSILFALLAVAGSMFFSDDAYARCCRRARCCAAASCCAATPCGSCNTGCNACSTGGCSTGGCSASGCSTGGCSASTIAPAAPVVASNSSSGSSYQSYSYEPGVTAPAATNTNTVVAPNYYYQTPMARQSGYTEYNSVLRGDHKVRAFTN